MFESLSISEEIIVVLNVPPLSLVSYELFPWLDLVYTTLTIHMLLLCFDVFQGRVLIGGAFSSPLSRFATLLIKLGLCQFVLIYFVVQSFLNFSIKASFSTLMFPLVPFVLLHDECKSQVDLIQRKLILAEDEWLIVFK